MFYNETGLLESRELQSHLAGNTDCRTVDFLQVCLTMVIGHADPLGAERVGGDDVGSCLKIASMNVLNDVRACQYQDIVVALHLTWEITEKVTTKIFFRQMIGLYHGTHGSIKSQDTPLVEFRLQCEHENINSRTLRGLKGVSRYPICSAP